MNESPSRAPTGGHASQSAADRIDLPQPIAEIVDVLADMPGAVAVVLGGSRDPAGTRESSQLGA
jgi:hypothetical protein